MLTQFVSDYMVTTSSLQKSWTARIIPSAELPYKYLLEMYSHIQYNYLYKTCQKLRA